MATKTFKTRIKLKYDELGSWSGFSALKGEMLLGHENGKVYAQVGTEDNTTNKLPLGIAGVNVDITGYPNNENTITTAQAAIADLNTRINNITGGGVVTSLGGKTGAITVDGDSGLQISTTNELSIKAASDTSLGVVKVKPGNGLTFSDAQINMNVATSTENGAMTSGDFNKLLGIEQNAQINKIEVVKVNDANLDIINKAVNITITEGTTNGAISVNGSNVPVHGLGSAAYTNSDVYQPKFTDGSATVATLSGNTLTLTSVAQSGGAIANGTEAAKLTFASAPTNDNRIVTESDISGIVGAMVYQGTLGTSGSEGSISELPEAVSANKGFVYVVETAGVYNGKTTQVGDMFVSNGTSWNLIQGNVPVTNHNATLEVGAANAANIATVEGVTITASVTASADKVNYGENSNVKAALDSLNTAVTTTLPASIGAISDNTITGDGAIIIPVNTTVGSNTIEIKHITHTVATPAAVMVGNDGFGHVVTGDALTASNIKYNETTTIAAAIDSKANDSDLTILTGRVTTTEGAITTLNGDENTNGSVKNTVATTINSALNGLDNSTNISTDNTTGAKTITNVKQVNGGISNGDQTVTIGKAAQSNEIYDLNVNSANNYIIFDCGDAEGWE